MLSKQCLKCGKDFEVAENEGYKRFCSIPCYKAREGQTVTDPYSEGQSEVADKLSQIEIGMLMNQSVSIAISQGGNTNIEENFKMLKELLLKLKKEHQK